MFPPKPKTNPKPNPNPNREQLFSEAIVWLPTDLDPNPNLNRGAIPDNWRGRK